MDNAKTIRSESKDSLVKRILLAGGETANVMKLSFILGAGLGAAGRFTGAEWIPAIPPALDIMGGNIAMPGKMACYVAYGAGVATSNIDRLYSAAANFLDKL